jgi:hypothetical protein
MDLSKTIATIPVDVTTIWVLVLLTIVLLRLVIGRELISQLIQLLNSLNPQGWAFLILIIGVTSAVLFNRVGIAAEVAAGIIGAGINMFTGQQRSTPPPGTWKWIRVRP